jgi:hypothetical protein
MFRATKSVKDESSEEISRTTASVNGGHRREAGSIAGIRRSNGFGALQRGPSARGWKATFMSM